MRLTALLIIVATLHVSANGYSQTVSFSGRNVPLQAVFSSIERQTGLSFFFNYSLIRETQPVTLEVKDVALEDALHEVLEGQDLDYYIKGKTIFIVRKQKEKGGDHAANNDPVLAATVRVEGTVYNESGEPLAGANIMVKELRKGTITDAKGEFKIASVPTNSTLIISFIGYAAERVVVKDATTLKVYLKVARNELDKAVVQAYGQTTERIATGNIGTVRAEEIAKQPVMNVLDAVQGQVPGAIVTNTSGYASGQIKVEIRGRNTINPAFPSDPLYIVDGVPLTVLDVTGRSNYGSGAPGFLQSGMDSYAGGQSPLFSLDPANIESIQVLKDADATAIYGSRGANGVILITTKNGKAGKSAFEMNVYHGETFISRTYSMANTQQYVAMRKEALYNDGHPIDVNYAPDIFLGDTTRYTNWQNFLQGKIGTRTNANASLSGGNTATTYRISGSYSNQRDMTAVSGGNSRGAFLLNLNHHSLNQKLSFGLSANYSYTVSNQVSLPGSPNMVPDAPPVYDKYGEINYAGWDQFFGGPGSSPFGLLLQPYKANTNFLNSSLLVSYELLKGLVIKTSLGYNNAITNQNTLEPIVSQDPANGTPLASNVIGNSQNQNIIVEPQLEWKLYLGPGKLDALIGGTAQKNTTTGSMIQGKGIPNDAVIQQIASAPIRNFSYNEGEYRYAGFFGRLNYNLSDKYIFNLNLRRDGSSRFGPGKQYGNFGSLGAAWIFSEENWIKRNLTFLSFAKIRASYGLTGGDQIGDYQYLTQWVFGQVSYNGLLPLTPIKHTDSLFHWQTNKKLEVGLDLALFKDRISIGVSRYVNRCDDQLIQFPLAFFTGFSNVLTNSPANVQNSGWEIILGSKILDGKDLKLSTRVSIGITRNKLVSYPNIAQSPYSGLLHVGQSLNIRRLLHSTGVDPQTGYYTFEDKNKDGQITFDQTGRTPDDTYTIDLAPKYDGSFSLDMLYKKFEISMLFYFRSQMGYRATSSLDVPGDATNQPVEVLKNHWQRPGQVAEYARFTTSPTDISWAYYSISDGWITDASFIRMQNLALTYSLLGRHWQIKGINDIKLSMRAQNLFVITNYKGTDPEVQSFGSLPLPRIITLGISFNF